MALYFENMFKKCTSTVLVSVRSYDERKQSTMKLVVLTTNEIFMNIKCLLSFDKIFMTSDREIFLIIHIES